MPPINKMKASNVTLANCEKDFILQCIRSRKRLDGRETYDYRNIKVSFGVERGHCEVQLGKTRVLAQVSCEITKPKENRQTEGQIFINIELSTMASPAFEAGRMTEYGVELNRFMERFFIESRAVDMESLCIVAGEKVWSVRVDVQVLDHGGNILDCASIAAITALKHFRRPDVSVMGEEVTVHSHQDREPVSLSILHMPVCVTFAFFDDGELLLVDPTDKEEAVMDGHMMMAMNIHREICGAVMGGGVSLEIDQIVRCSKIAVVKVTEIIELIKSSLSEDEKQRLTGKIGVFESTKKITTTVAETTAMDITEAVKTGQEITNNNTPPSQDNNIWHADIKGPGTAQIGHGGNNTWQDMEEESHVIEIESDEDVENAVKSEPKNKEPRTSSAITIDDDSEEEDVVVLTSDSISGVKTSSEKIPDEGVDLMAALKKPAPPTDSMMTRSASKNKKRRKKKT
ncbi:exosome complex component RRP45 isoform X2 [Exaiptasia diaphana]|uniref:Exosome complex component RRP45 n=1 Tax=Exaiptasia diaphana TaxID=2652724 RepID=A0A913Y5G0_EXADI|nr:exosome complex component RRP45 isoform X2 [Exaiptasia diaphana]KXJ22400.1 Exosome complex component RRP45 [Exaiptasia diaphana]